ncbi:MAG TPA: hypothetical protein VFH73_17000, partial [Polyangia bacterium]|nr:hypothetical protein [Polyangia bacterium]
MRTEQRRRGSRLVIVKCASAVGVLILLASGALAQAATIAVSSPMPADGDAPDIVCTLREAIKAATSRRNYNGCILTGSSSVNTILLPFGTYKLTSTLPTVGSNIQIIGSGYARTTIDGNTQGGVLGAIVLSGTGIQLSDLALQNFRDSAVKVQAGSDTRITAVAFRANGNSNSSGSEIDNSGRTKVLSCSFQSPPPIRPFGSLIRSSGSGAEIIITQSTISGSHAFHGVLYNAAGSSMFLYNSTVGGNIDDASGVIHNEAGAVLGIGFSTIAFNFSSVARGSAISNDPGGSVTVSESMIFGPRTFTGTPTCVGAITSGGYNVFDASSPCAPLAEGDITTSTPGLDTNGDQPKPHGGVAPVYLPLAGSPLIAHVDASFCDTIDQRRVGRPLWPANCATGSVDIANAVLVVRNPASLSTGDGNVLAQIQTIFGADRVSVFPDVFQGPATFPGVVVISGSVSDANIGTHFRNLGQGVVVLKQSIYDEMNMTNSSATSSEGT